MGRCFKFKFIAFVFIFAMTTVHGSESPVVSVRIGKSLKNIKVTGTDLMRHLAFNNDKKKFSGKKTVKFNCESFTSLNKVKNKPIMLATLESATGIISFEHEKYLGTFRVVTSPAGDSCDIINDVPIEAYIGSLLTKEMNSKWPIEALKAQAVAARTYALNKMKTQQVTKELGNEAFYDLESSEKHQVGGTFFDLTDSTKKASKETKGEVLLTESGLLNPIYFHAKCGGRTLRPDQVWKHKEESYQGVNCPFCYDKGAKAWDSVISYSRMKEFLNWASEKNYINKLNVSDISTVTLIPDEQDKLSITLYVNDRPYIIEKTIFRNFFGRVLFPSNNFAIKIKDGNFVLSGDGLGHGVGMCQMGAFALANMGWSYKKILKHYFPQHQLKKLY